MFEYLFCCSVSSNSGYSSSFFVVCSLTVETRNVNIVKAKGIERTCTDCDLPAVQLLIRKIPELKKQSVKQIIMNIQANNRIILLVYAQQSRFHWQSVSNKRHGRRKHKEINLCLISSLVLFVCLSLFFFLFCYVFSVIRVFYQFMKTLR